MPSLSRNNNELGAILVVDDDGAVRDSLAVLLESAGFNCRSFSSGDELLDFQHISDAACIILDISLPGRDGIAVFSELTERTVNTPVIFLTAHRANADRARRMNTPFAVLEKPIRDHDLLSAVYQATQL